MHALMTAIHLIVCFGLVISVLLQSGKGGGLAGAFGGQGGAQTIFGGRGAATFLSKATTVLGALFLLTALLLAIVPRSSERPARSIIQEKAQETGTPPATAPEATTPGQALPGAGALPGEQAAPPAGGASEKSSQGKSQDAQQPQGGGSQGGQKDKTDKG